MAEDLISNNFIDNIDKVTIRKYLNLIKIVLSLSIVFAFLESLSWIRYLKIKLPPNPDFAKYYNYRIAPAIGISMLLMSILSWAFYLKGYKLVYAGIKNDDASFFNDGIKACYKGGFVGLLGFVIMITILILNILILK